MCDACGISEHRVSDTSWNNPNKCIFSHKGSPGRDILKGTYSFPVKCQHTKDEVMKNRKFYSGAQENTSPPSV